MRVGAVIALVILAFWPARVPSRSQSVILPLSSVPASAAVPVADPIRVGVLVGTLILVSVGWLIGSPLVVVATPIVASGGWRQYTRQERRRRHRARSAAMVAFTEGVAAGLRAGGSLSASVTRALEADRADAEATPPASERGGSTTHRHPGLREVAAALAAGRTLSAAFTDSFTRESLSADDRLVATAVVALSRSGGAAVDALERVVDTLRERQAWHEDLRTQAQQALSSAAVMFVLPLVFGVAAALVDGGVGELYRTRMEGALCGGSALLLSLLGWEWQQRLVAVR